MVRPAYLAVLLSTVAVPALAQDQPDARPGDSVDSRDVIVVTAQRIITPALNDVPVEREYDTDSIDSYAVGTVSEVFDEIARENGDEEPALLVNGEPVSGIDDIGDYPVEAIARIEVLPRGSASRVGGAAGQRTYNIVLLNSVTTATATASRRAATDGGWHGDQGELQLTYIRGPDRANLTLRARDSGLLLESERDVIQPAPALPFAPAGNVLPFPVGAAELDPALSLLAGRPVGATGLPAGTGNPTLAEFAAVAGRLNPADPAQFRSLRSENDAYEAAFAGSLRAASWLTASLNGRLEWNEDSGLSGLPEGLFLVPAGTPFSRDVLLAFSDAARPLRSGSKVENGNATLMLSGRAGPWNPRLTARLARQERSYLYERTAPDPSNPLTLPPGESPFSPGLAAAIPVISNLTRTRTSSEGLRADVDGPLFGLPAGSIRVRAGAGIDWTRLTTLSAAGSPGYSRSLTTLLAGLTLPIASARQDVLAALGELEVSADLLRIDLSDRAAAWHGSAGVSWQLRPWLRLGGGFDRKRNPPDVELLSAPVISYPNVRLFDPLRQETVDVTAVTGGNPALRAERVDSIRLSVGAAPLPKYNLQLQLDYTATNSRDMIGGLPPTNAAVVAAFPARYQRDATGRLVLVDSRSINLLRQDQDQIRYSASMTVPLYPGSGSEPGVSAQPAGPRPRLEFALAHTFLLNNRLQIGPGLPEIDLLREGASGIGGSRPRHLIDGSIALSDRGTGIRLNGSWRSAASLFAGTQFDPQRIRFGSLAIFDLRVFAETERLLPGRGWAKDGRITIAVQNLANARQDVTDSAGRTPLSYQPAYRDAIGRTVSLELRKVF